MSILINKDTKVVIQGITGKYGRDQAQKMIEFGTKVVAGVSPGKQGTEIFGVPIYDTVLEAVQKHQANASIIYVPPTKAKDAALEAICAGGGLLMIASEGVPIKDSMVIKKVAREKGTWVVGPNTIGLITPGECMIGSLAHEFTSKGHVGIVTRGGTIAIELARILTEAGFGQTTIIGSGGDRVIGRIPVEYLKEFEKDPETKAVVLNGEIGGGKETECANYIPQMTKPVFAYILGRCAPPGKRMGHIGAIIGSKAETFEEKRRVLAEAGAIVVDTPWQIAEHLKKMGI